jgi:hypothetical protein
MDETQELLDVVLPADDEAAVQAACEAEQSRDDQLD